MKLFEITQMELDLSDITVTTPVTSGPVDFTGNGPDIDLAKGTITDFLELLERGPKDNEFMIRVINETMGFPLSYGEVYNFVAEADVTPWDIIYDELNDSNRKIIDTIIDSGDWVGIEPEIRNIYGQIAADDKSGQLAEAAERWLDNNAPKEVWLEIDAGEHGYADTVVSDDHEEDVRIFASFRNNEFIASIGQRDLLNVVMDEIDRDFVNNAMGVNVHVEITSLDYTNGSLYLMNGVDPIPFKDGSTVDEFNGQVREILSSYGY